ncbi:hypothetical protein NYD60_03120 [Burkholderia thailandensis]|uniref:hypothetical protein n=1 Tax=Burkholderia thailandensis TaxID=57975 RepID=UPI00217F201B|nr:hypothetical protein [Burkholderia thailandensis]MCS6498999.1 hypothetical protein [Burkholderia thailandensis]
MTTTDKSRADALTDQQLIDMWSAANYAIGTGKGSKGAVVAMRAILAASPVEQPAAAPIDDPTIPAELHHDTAKLVRRFARALANKLLAAQRKYGYSDNWMRDGWADECRAELMRHIQKGDPRDVAAYCAFLWHHNESTATTPSPADERAAKISDYLNAPGMWAQIYCCAVFVHGWPSDMARGAADEAVKEFGDAACKTVADLTHTLDEVLRVD